MANASKLNGLEVAAKCLLRRVPVFNEYKVERSDKLGNKRKMEKHKGARLEKCRKLFFFLIGYNVSEIREIL